MNNKMFGEFLGLVNIGDWEKSFEDFFLKDMKMFNSIQKRAFFI